ncbi:hypothetical protein Emag_005414 [Eimeria magna]
MDESFQLVPRKAGCVDLVSVKKPAFDQKPLAAMSLGNQGLCLKLGILLPLLLEGWKFSAAGGPHLTPPNSESETAGSQVHLWESVARNEDGSASSFPLSPLFTHSFFDSVWDSAETETDADPRENTEITQPIQPSVTSSPRASFLRKAWPSMLFASLAAFLSVSLVAGHGNRSATPLKAWSALTPRLDAVEKLENVESISNKEIFSQLNAVRSLLPAAAKLAKAVGTTEAQQLLGLAYAAVPAGKQQMKGKNIMELQGCLAGALDALRRLHQAACAAAEIADAYDYEDGNALVSALPMCEDKSLSRAQREGLAPFKTSVHFSYLHYMQLSKRVQMLREKIEGERPPYAIGDIKTALYSTAADLEYLRKAKEDRRRAFKRALERRQGLQATLRLLLAQQTFKGLQELHEEFKLVGVYVALAEEAAASGLEGAKMNSNLEALKESIAKNEVLLASLISESTTVLTGDNFEKMKTQAKRVETFLELLKYQLEKTWQSATSQTKIPASLDAPLKVKAQMSLTQALECACRKQEVQATVESMRTAIAEALTYRSGDPEQSMGNDLASIFLKEVNYIAGRTDKINANVNSCKRSLQQLENLKGVESMTRAAAAIGAASLAELVDAQLLIIKIHLLSSLEEETSSVMADAAAAFLNNQHLAELQNRINCAHHAAREAGTLQEKAQAVAEMRKIADEVEDAGRK